MYSFAKDPSGRDQLASEPNEQNKHPFESAGYIYFYQDDRGDTRILLFQDHRGQYEFSTVCKADYGISNRVNGHEEKYPKAKYISRYKLYGEERPAITALRAAIKETDGLISEPPPIDTRCFDIVTNAHKCWCHDTRPIQTIISFIPYRLTAEKAEELCRHPGYRQFRRVVSAMLHIVNHHVFLTVDGDELALKQYRPFNQRLLNDYPRELREIFLHTLQKPNPAPVAEVGMFAPEVIRPEIEGIPSEICQLFSAELCKYLLSYNGKYKNSEHFSVLEFDDEMDKALLNAGVLDPVSQEVMNRPVKISNNQYYDINTLSALIKSKRPLLCFITRAEFKPEEIQPAPEMQDRINQWCAKLKWANSQPSATPPARLHK